MRTQTTHLAALCFAFLSCASSLGCGGAELDVTTEASDAAGDDAGETLDAGGDSSTSTTDMRATSNVGEDVGGDAGEDMGREPQPQPVSPCDNGDCWETELAAPPCRTASHDEDYSSGNYNVHRYATNLWAGAPTVVEVARTAGNWEPAIVLRGADGATYFDGDVGSSTGPVRVEGASSGASATATVEVDTTTAAHVFVTSRAALQSDFVDRIPTDAVYTVSITNDCGGDQVDCVVNGNQVAEPACGWLIYVGRNVVPNLKGTRQERLTDASRVAWWSLKEGVLFLDNPIAYSNCNFTTGDEHIEPLETCPSGRAWQVGMSAIQVPAVTLAVAEQTAGELYAGMTVDEVLRDTAQHGALSPSQVDSVVNSSGDLRRSWLLRNSAIGFNHQVGPVTRECIDDSLSWCYGTGWDATAKFAPDRAGAMEAISDIEGLLDQVAP